MAIVMTKNAEMNVTIVEKLVTEHSSVQNQKWRKAQQKAKVKRVEAKEERVEKGRVCQDHVGRAVDRISLTSVPQQARVARDCLCQRRGAHGGQAHFLDRHHNNGDNGCLERARRNEKAKEKGSPASAS